MGAIQTDRTCVPSLQKPCLHFSTRSTPIHLLIPVTLHPSILNTHTPKNETTPSCFIHPLSVFYSFTGASLPLRWLFPSSVFVCLSCLLLFSCIKKSYSFLFQCVSQSVCLSLSMWPSSWLSGCRWKVGSPSGRPHQADSEG